MLRSNALEGKMSVKVKEAWQSFRGVVEEFLGNKKDPNYREFVRRLIKIFQNMGCRMSKISKYGFQGSFAYNKIKMYRNYRV